MRRLDKRSYPTQCLVRYPNAQSVRFLGKAINLTEIAEYYPDIPIDHGFLSRVFRGLRRPGLRKSRLIATALGMDLESFADGIEILYASQHVRRQPKLDDDDDDYPNLDAMIR